MKNIYDECIDQYQGQHKKLSEIEAYIVLGYGRKFTSLNLVLALSLLKSPPSLNAFRPVTEHMGKGITIYLAKGKYSLEWICKICMDFFHRVTQK